MRRIINFFIILVLLAAAIPAAVGSVRALPAMARLASHHWQTLAAFAGGFFVWWLLYLFFRTRDNYRFLETLDHELVHILFALLTGGNVKSANISSLGSGSVEVERSNALVSIAPYFLSLPLLVLPILYTGYGPKSAYIANLIAGWIVSYHILKTFDSLHPKQSDFAATTIPIAYILTLASLLVWLVGSLSLAETGLPGAKRFLIFLGHNFRDAPGWIMAMIAKYR